MIEVPVLLNYDYDKIIGYLKVDESYLPPDGNYVFSLGYAVKDADYDKDIDDIVITKHKLLCVSLQTDEQYLEYLKHKGS